MTRSTCPLIGRLVKAASLFVACAVLVLLLGLSRPVLADGIIIPDPPPVPNPPPLAETWLTIRYHHVTVTIRNQVAVTRVDQEFLNENDWECEGTYLFPLPEGAAVSEFAMWVDGERIEGQILDADQARAIYEDIVRQRRDPALLEYVGQGAVQARIFPIPPGGVRRIELEYSQVLPIENGMVRYVYPLNTERFSARPIEEVTIQVEIESQDAMRAIYSPTHQDRVYIERDGNYRAAIGYEASNVLPTEDFELVYTVSQEDVGLSLLTYREPAEDGFFLLLVAPSVEVDEEAIIPRDIFLILDTSGSMEGEKLEQAKGALVYVLEHLNVEDRFNVIAFSTGLQQYARELRPASEADDAAAWVEMLEATGMTDINRALLEALTQVDARRPTVFIFLTDGLPTQGETNVERIIANVETSAPENVRIFPFGVGDDVDTVLLDALAQQHGGAASYVRPGERIDEEVSAFYAKISLPVLSNISLEFGDALVEDAYPYPLPDLFAGAQLIVAGRYRGSGPVEIRLAGEVNGERREFVYEGYLRPEGGDAFIPRLWATRKIGHLLRQIRLYGEDPELVDAVIDLSIRYGIITPYTSFLIQEDRDIWTEEGRDALEGEFMAQPTMPSFGAPSVERAEFEGGMTGAESGGAPMPAEAAHVVRIVGSKTFVLRDGVWVDTTFDPSQMTTTQVGFGTDSYFDLLAARPGWGAYFALGSRVIFVADGVAYEIVEGEGGPVVIPPTVAPESPLTPDAVVEPTPTPAAGGRPCPGALAMLGLALVWSARRRLRGQG